MVAFFIDNGARWVRHQRARYRALGVPLSPATRLLLQAFSVATLDCVRVVEVAEIENPPFYAALEQAGQPLPLDFRQMAGITFVDTVLVSRGRKRPGEFPIALLFHELIHVVQYASLGVDEFIRRYVTGWASAGFDYYRIPLERDAYELQARFHAGHSPQDVEADVRGRLGMDAPADTNGLSRGAMLPPVKLLDEMDEQMWSLLQRNLTGITAAEADWRPHPAANNVRWLVGHLAWFEEWAHDALRQQGRYLLDRDPTAYLDGTIRELIARFAAARARYRIRLAELDDGDLARQLSYFGRYDVSGLDLLKTHALHLAGHRFQVRYVRGTYSRAHGTRKADFDPW